jgi:hypothetical protein
MAWPPKVGHFANCFRYVVPALSQNPLATQHRTGKCIKRGAGSQTRTLHTRPYRLPARVKVGPLRLGGAPFFRFFLL